MIKYICFLVASTQSKQYIKITNSRTHASQQPYTYIFFPSRALEHRSNRFSFTCSTLFILECNQNFLKPLKITFNVTTCNITNS